jgi:hypothetical protein
MILSSMSVTFCTNRTVSRRRSQVAAQHVEDDGGATVADVRVALDGRPAHVHADAARLCGTNATSSRRRVS